MINPEKKPATENPWYVLASLYRDVKVKKPYRSELERYSDNRRFWNAWVSQDMTEEQKAAIKDSRGRSILSDAPEWNSIKAQVEEIFKKRLPNAKLPLPSELPEFKYIDFHITFSGFFFPVGAHFIDTIFDGANFQSAVFSGPVTFNRVTIRDANFFAAVFSGGVGFIFVKISRSAIFQNAIFSGYANFGRAEFPRNANFNRTVFSRHADFQTATFPGEASFREAVFSGDANFMNATFSGDASFREAVFSEEANFMNVIFSGDANFRNSTFSGVSKFIKTKFSEAADFSDAVFDAPCNFREVEFKAAYPNLLGTLLHSKTNVTAENKYWPNARIEQSNNDNNYVSESCAHLRQNMASQGLTEAAHFFFRREMDHKAKLSRWWERPFYEVYRLAEYGLGVWQPLVGIFLLWLSGALSLNIWGCLNWTTAFGLSAANIFKFFGFQRVYFEGNVIANLNPYLQSMTAAQTVFGYVLLFLLGLGLRNRFRLK